MPTRYRWFRIQLPARALNLEDIIAMCPFGTDSLYGFAKVYSLGVASYRFLWRARVTVTKLDEEGLPSYEQIESVGITDFALVSLEGMVFLRVVNPGRSIRDLLNALETLVGMGFTARPVTFEKRHPASAVLGAVDSAKLVGLKVAGTVLADDLVARMEFASKEGMIIESMAVLSGLQYKVEHAVFEVVLSGLKGQVAFSTNGTAKISGQLAPKLVSLVEQDLPSLMG